MGRFVSVIFCSIVLCCQNKASDEQKLILTFASCNNQNLDSLQIWFSVLSTKPDYFIWTGDIIYPNEETPQGLKEGYAVQKSNKEYQELVAKTKILGIFDDHDSAMNDGGANNPYLNEAKELLLDFLDEPLDSQRQKRDGIYDSYTMANGFVKTILLDTRWFRSDLLPSDDPNMRYQPSNVGTILGDEQWTWLESELSDPKSQLIILASSIQFLNDFHGFEKWGNFIHERQKLINLLNASGKQVIVVSGDRHFAEISKLNDQILEVTSSGMTHTYRAAKESNPLRISPLIVERNFGVIEITYDNTGATVELIKLMGDIDEVLWTYKPIKTQPQ